MAGRAPVRGGFDALPGTLYLTCPECNSVNVVMNVDLEDPPLLDIDPCAGTCGASWSVEVTSNASWWTRKEEPHGG